MLRDGQNLERNIADTDRSVKLMWDPGQRSLSRSEDKPAMGVPAVHQRNLCCKPCSFWAVVHNDTTEWVGDRCSGRCAEPSGHPQHFCVCETHPLLPTIDDHMAGARPGLPSVMRAPGAPPAGAPGPGACQRARSPRVTPQSTAPDHRPAAARTAIVTIRKT